MSLRSETDGAAGLLAAAGIHTRIAVDLPDLTPAVDNVLAWAVREGVTNLLRHSEPQVCSIQATRQGGRVRLEIVNDGARPPSGESGDGTGLAGLAGRAQALSGSVSTERARDGRFRLLVEVQDTAGKADA